MGTMRKLAHVSTAMAALLSPSFASAQVTSVFGRNADVTALNSDYSITQINGAL